MRPIPADAPRVLLLARVFGAGGRTLALGLRDDYVVITGRLGDGLRRWRREALDAALIVEERETDALAIASALRAARPFAQLRPPILAVVPAADGGLALRRVGVDAWVPPDVADGELRARLRALLRCPPSGILHVGALRLDPFRRDARWGEEALPLRPLEFALLYELARSPGLWQPSATLSAALWPGEGRVEGGRLAAHVYRLRQALGRRARHIQGRRGLGYRFHVRAANPRGRSRRHAHPGL